MIRFMPDTWFEAVMRPIAMAAPNGHVYVEIMAPDLRFAFAIGLAAMLLLSLRRRPPLNRPTRTLLALVALAFVPWLLTSGNGRYFIPYLLIAGPLCIALAWALPGTKAIRGAAIGLMLGLQVFVVLYATNPWRSWSLTHWQEAPYFDVAIPADVRAAPATFVTITSISYSLVYPLFHPQSHWINISSMIADTARSIEARRAHALFAGTRPLYLLVPSQPMHMASGNVPNAELQDVIDLRLNSHRLALDRSQPCRLMLSRRLAMEAYGDLAKAKPERVAQLGFWLCPLRYPAERKTAPPAPATFDAVFRKLEQACPRFFPPGAETVPFGAGAMRNYSGADMKVLVADDGMVYYKYWRALNFEPVGSIAEVTSDNFKMDCSNMRGRSGLPWERAI
ncbi:hypothetical protein FN976_26440 [Caenimonas sedimenti]|uniref:Uncharacterized protein n=1 Tax=Caenimonas sedimenti TaxID=2596921 RepID=A0A562ZF92_9BURK|nr:hypothetical protein [Caenimonas sedimenti]TWO66655.1 hypothetical protein FN976_26440 [Caenimonas sedimenti]